MQEHRSQIAAQTRRWMFCHMFLYDARTTWLLNHRSLYMAA
jgi:hypothetical protein